MSPRDLLLPSEITDWKLSFKNLSTLGAIRLGFLPMENLCTFTVTIYLKKTTFQDYNGITKFLLTILSANPPIPICCHSNSVFFNCFYICVNVSYALFSRLVFWRMNFSELCKCMKYKFKILSVGVIHLWEKAPWELVVSCQKFPIFNIVYKRDLITTEVLMATSQTATNILRYRYL